MNRPLKNIFICCFTSENHICIVHIYARTHAHRKAEFLIGNAFCLREMIRKVLPPVKCWGLNGHLLGLEKLVCSCREQLECSLSVVRSLLSALKHWFLIWKPFKTLTIITTLSLHGRLFFFLNSAFCLWMGVIKSLFLTLGWTKWRTFLICVKCK